MHGLSNMGFHSPGSPDCAHYWVLILPAEKNTQQAMFSELLICAKGYSKDFAPLTHLTLLTMLRSCIFQLRNWHSHLGRQFGSGFTKVNRLFFFDYAVQHAGF